MDVMILSVIIVFFALLGLVNFCVGMGKWLRHTGDMPSAVLVVEIFEDEKSTEARLLQAVDTAGGIPMAVICTRGSENESICRKFCRDREIPMAFEWNEINGILHRL